MIDTVLARIMDEDYPIPIPTRWVPDGKAFLLQVFVVGRWRYMSVSARQPRRLRPQDVLRVRHTLALNAPGPRYHDAPLEMDPSL